MNERGGEPLFQRFELGPGLRLLVHPTQKLKTVVVKAYLTGDLGDAVTRRALVPMLLRRGTRNYFDMQAIQRHLDALYGASVVADVMKVGEWHSLKFRLETVNGAFLPGQTDVYEKSLQFLEEMMFAPRLEGGRFVDDFFEQEKHNLERVIESVVDNKSRYALERLIQHMAADEPYKLYEYGRREDLPGIDTAGATEEWAHCIHRLPLDIYVAGDVDVDETRDLVSSVFSGARNGDLRPAPPPEPRPVGEPRMIEERLDVNQGKLCLGFRHNHTYARGDLEAATIMNGVLGAFSHSKLFQNVREKASLAYDAYSSLERVKGFLFISCGIAVENFDRARSICLDQIKALQRGEISEVELVSTRESFDNHVTMLEDNYASLMDVDYTWSLNGRTFNLNDYRQRLRSVTPERIVEAAQGLHLDTVYFLRD